MSTSPTQTDVTHQQAHTAVRTDQLLGIDMVLVGGGHVPTNTSDSITSELSTSSIEPSASMAERQAPPIIEIDQSVDPQASLESLRQDHDHNCPLCAGATHCTQTVFGEGNPNADLMFVGEAPGAEEDRTGRPFVGRAGAKLDEMIQAMGYQREEVYIANVLKTRPPNNRTPLEDEVAACGPYLAAQVAIVRPSVIVTLGGPASKLLLKTERGITQLRGSWGVYHAQSMQVPVMPTFHPAFLLRNPTREVRLQVWEDLQQVMGRLGQTRPE